MAAAPRLTVEADSINATVVGADAVAGSAIFDLAVREALKALSVKAGQLCTNIRRIIVPATLADDFTEALAAKVRNLAVGDPASATTRVGPLINAAQRQEAEANIGRLEAETRIVARAALPETPPQSGFVAPTLMRCDNPLEAQSVHEVEVFGPCATILPYRDTSEAVALVRKAEGSLALSLFSNDHGLQTGIVSDMAAWHGRLMLVDDEVGKAHTGHFNVMPQCVHGGPGRAGDGEELGGLRGLRFHMQRSAVQAGPSALSALADMAVEATL
jgi:3,4-dehydroadipyl-CoA semialdehyde dehydrogenase